MTQRYLLDTNILSALLREPKGPLRERIEDVGEDAVVTSVIVAAELRCGALKSGSDRLQSAVQRMLQHLVTLPFKAPDDAEYAVIRAYLEREGTPIGPNDLLIAAQARQRDLVVVTARVREFERVPELEVENWLR